MESAEFYRQDMVKTQLLARDIRDNRVLEAMGRIPRHRFINNFSLKEAYSDKPLPIEMGQTISQPYIVALMCATCCLKGDERVLEVGTGSGYQTAVLSLLAAEVYTIERMGPLYSSSRLTFDRMNIKNIISIYGDGFKGYRDRAPYKAIIVSAASKSVPEELKDQLLEGGILVIPVGPVGRTQLLKVIKRRGGLFTENTIGRVLFVPMLEGLE